MGVRPRSWLVGRPWHRLGLVLGATALVLLFVVSVIQVVPAQLADTSGLVPKARAEEVGRTRTATLALLAGAIALVGAVYTARTFGLNRRGQITDRFIRGIEQLGSESLDIRVGGIYVLDSVAHESERDHRPVMETLAAYIRRHSPQGQANLPGNFPLDIHAAMVVIARRNRAFEEEEGDLDLRYVNLSYLRLGRSADLRGLDFESSTLDHVHLRGVDLTGANLKGSTLIYARLDEARLRDAQLYGAQLGGAQLVGADLRGAMLSGANLEQAFLFRADLRGAYLRSYFGPDRSGEVVDYIPARLGADGSREAADLVEAMYDEETQWPNMPPGFPFDRDARGARNVGTSPKAGRS